MNNRMSGVGMEVGVGQGMGNPTLLRSCSAPLRKSACRLNFPSECKLSKFRCVGVSNARQTDSISTFLARATPANTCKSLLALVSQDQSIVPLDCGEVDHTKTNFPRLHRPDAFSPESPCKTLEIDFHDRRSAYRLRLGKAHRVSHCLLRL